ncbi:MAG: flagellar biosynthesis protein FlhB [Beijerinckiaceae bacterium]|nr:flagellar biosynthesis protein FlhB [Beijerinckiaceae bacterium]
MSDTSSEDKTEEATDKKVSDAREQGNLPHSREASVFFSLGSTLIIVSLVLKENIKPLVEAMTHVFARPDLYPLNTPADVMSLLNVMVSAAAVFMIPMVTILMVSGLVASFVQGVPQVSFSRIAPKFSKISPVAGLKRMFSMDGLIQFLKNLAKLVLVALVSYMVLRGDFESLVQTIYIDPSKIGPIILDMIARLLSGCCVAYALLTAADVLWTRVKWSRDLRMTKQEIKDEMKAAEGDPIFKAKRRSIAMDRHRRRMMAAVPKATLVIANPTHFAIALRYVKEEGGAPLVLAKGQDLIALKIREIAEANGIPVIEDKALARSMYDHVEVSKMIPAEFYKAVAELIHFLQARANRQPRSF